MKMSWIRKIVINGRHITSEDDFHDEIEGLSSGEAYGRNLDALYDELSVSGDLIIIENTGAFLRNLGTFAENALNVFKDAMENNDELIVLFR